MYFFQWINQHSAFKQFWAKIRLGKAKRGAQAVSNTKFEEDYESIPFISQEYSPAHIEQKWYSKWIEKKYFHADVEKLKQNPNAKKFVMMLPPPNVTGSLHLGHALLLSIEDTLVRWKRMNGYETLFLPGLDHAGISTQNVVENNLWKERQLTRHNLGREKFLKETWKWKKQ
jgi:valyl-tRNA synthetase